MFNFKNFKNEKFDLFFHLHKSCLFTKFENMEDNTTSGNRWWVYPINFDNFFKQLIAFNENLKATFDGSSDKITLISCKYFGWDLTRVELAEQQFLA